jgi:heat shock protein HslJ/membrane-bound inhibitor of C-type lysozyme
MALLNSLPRLSRSSLALLVILASTAPSADSQQPRSAGSPLAGTSWQLVRFQGGDGAVLTPDDGSKYTVAFDKTGNLSARIDCNRGRGTWASSGPGALQLSPLALTRAMCPPGSLHDQIARQWSNIRSYVMKDGHLFLSLMADGGIYEFGAVTTQAPSGPPPSGLAPSGSAPSGSFKSPVSSKGPITWICGQGTAATDLLRVTFYETQPSMALLEHGGTARPAFQVKAASGSRYEGDGVQFWEARGEATLTWMGAASTCKPK